MRLIALVLAALFFAGCGGDSALQRNAAEQELFGPSYLNFHSFTQIKDWTGNDAPDGIDAQLEFLDQFGDPTKAAGTVLFELFDYRRADPDMRGERLAYWTGSLVTLEEQQRQWNKISRTYGFKLEFPQISPTKSYVLTAMFQSSSGGRLFAHMVLLAEETPSATQPSTRPAKKSP